MRKVFISSLVPVYLSLIAGAPMLAVISLVGGAPSGAWRASAVLFSPALYALGYVFVAALLSRLTLSAILPGRFARDLAHQVYGPRRLYALGWTSVYYCTPIYHAVLAVPALKRWVFRAFGYRGSTNFTCYPDTWLRDLPLLSIGEGAYLSNKATVSPNLCLLNGTITIAPVTIGARSMVGHQTMIGPAVVVGDDTEIGNGAIVGWGAHIGSRCFVGHYAAIDVNARVGDGCIVGNRSYIGHKARIASGVSIAPGTAVPARAVIRSQADADFIGQVGSSTPPHVYPVREYAHEEARTRLEYGLNRDGGI